MSKTTLRLLCLLPLLAFAACSSDDDSKSTVPHDTQAPSVVSVVPPAGVVDLNLLASLTVTFSEAMNAATLNAQTVLLDSGAVALELYPSPSAEMLVLRADSLLPASKLVTLAIDGAEDLAGNAIVPFRATLTTGPLDCVHLSDRFEPNEQAGQAAPVRVDTLYTGLATCQDDTDMFRFSVTDTVMVTAKTHIVFANDDGWQIYWERQDGVTYMATLGTTAHTGETESFHYSFLPGTYCLRLWSIDPEERILYDLELETGAPCQDDAFEDNDFEDQPAATVPGSHEGLTACYLDADWYAFSVSDGDTITFTMDTHEYTDFRRMVIREPGGEQIWANPSDLETPVSTVSLPATAAGTARVMCMVWTDGVVYDMTITVD